MRTRVQKCGGFAPIIIAIAVAAVLAVIGGVVFYLKIKVPTSERIACTQEAKQCPDGSYVGHTGPNCEFAQCPNATSSDATVTWKIYRNEKYGFEFKYPEKLFAQEIDESFVLRESQILPDETEMPFLSFSIEKNPLDLLLKDYYDGQPGVNLYEQTQPEDILDIKIGGRFAKKFNPSATFAGGEIIIIPLKSAFLVIDDFGGVFRQAALLDQILSTFKFIAPNKSGMGILSGKVTIGPICPVERVDVPCPVPPETYTSREVIVYASNETTIVARAHFTADGTYRFELPVGQYAVAVPRSGIGGSKNLPKTVTVSAGETTVFDFNIDTGIR